MKKITFEIGVTSFIAAFFISALFVGLAQAQVQTLSGMVTVNGDPIQIADEEHFFAYGTVRAVETIGANLGNEVSIQEGGQYEMALFPGTYDLDLSYNYQLYDETIEACKWYLYIDHYPVVQDITISADTTVDIPAPIYTLSGYVTDTEGVGLACVKISTHYNSHGEPSGGIIVTHTPQPMAVTSSTCCQELIHWK